MARQDDATNQPTGGSGVSFSANKSIFENPNALAETYIPDDLPERSEQLNQIHRNFELIDLGRAPSNQFIYGKTGQGKTAGVKLKLRQLEAWAEAEGIDISSVWVGCDGVSKSYHVWQELVAELRGPGAELPQGHTQKELFRKAKNLLEQRGGFVIIVFDEIDNIGDDDHVVKELSRMDADGVETSMIGITNDTRFVESLNPDTQGSLAEEEIEFPPYNAGQLRSILKRRAAEAIRDTWMDDTGGFQSNVLEEDVVPLCAAKAAKDNGDARYAIKLFFQSCKLANNEGRDTVREADVWEAEEKMKTQAYVNSLRSMPTQEQLPTLALTLLTMKRDETRLPTTEIHEQYRHLAQQVNEDVVTVRWLRERLGDVYGLNIIGRETTKAGDIGRQSVWWLECPPEVILDTLEEDRSFSELDFGRFREHL